MADQPADRYPDSEGPFAGPGNSFPLNTAARVKNAWARIHQGPTMMNHTAAEIASIKAKIMARAKEMGIMLEEHKTPEAAARSASTGEIEERYTLSRVELRSMDKSSREIGGFAAVFGRESRMMEGRSERFREIVLPTFFNKSRADSWPGAGGGVVCRYNHDDFHMLGSTRSGTLRLALNEQGLEYTVDCPETRQDVFELVARGDISQSSMAMIVFEDDWNYDNGYAQRNLVDGKLIDVAPVINPAYTDTSVGLRSLARFVGAPEDDVVKYAGTQELRRFFARSDIDGGAPRRPWSGAKARAYMRGKRPTDPFKRG